jgi:hypothetical protein
MPQKSDQPPAIGQPGENPAIEPDRGEDDRAGDDLHEKRRGVHQDQTVADHRNGQSPQHGADDRAAAPHQRSAAEHDGSDHVKLKADRRVGGAGAEPGRDDEARARGTYAGEHKGRGGHPRCRHAHLPGGLRIGADRGDLPPIPRFPQGDVADEGDHDGDHGGDRDAQHPAAPEFEKARHTLDRYRVALGQQQRQATQHRQAGKRNDEGRDLLIGGKPSLNAPHDRPQQQHGQHHQRPGNRRRQGNGRQCVGQRHGRADRQVDAPGRDDERHADRDDQHRRQLPQQVQDVSRQQERLRGQSKHDAAAQEERGDRQHLRVLEQEVGQAAA